MLPPTNYLYHMKNWIYTLALLVSTLAAQAQIDMNYLPVGSDAPTIVGTDQNGTNINSTELLKEHNAVVLLFYRGSWCPVCARHLTQLQDSLQLILDKNVAVLVVTPETPESIEKMTSKTGATFSIVHDQDYQIMNNYKVAYTISKETVPSYYSFVKGMTTKANGNKDGQLPVPATYVIGKDGKVAYVQYDPNYKNRASVQDILNNLPQ